MKRVAVGVVVSMLVCGLAGYSISEDRPIVAVFDIEVQDVELPVKTIEKLNNYLCSLLAEKGYQVVPRAKLKESLQEKKKESYKQCYDQACQIEIGRELAAEKTLATQIIMLGSKCKVTLTLYDLKRSASEAGTTSSGGCGEDEVVELLEKSVKGLAKAGGTAPPAAPQGVAVSGPAPSSTPTPGNGTKESKATTAPFVRKDPRERPSAVFALYYVDHQGADAMTRYTGYQANSGGTFSLPGTSAKLNLVNAAGQIVPGFFSGGKAYVVGEPGQRFAIVLRNNSDGRLECVASVDGLDVIDGLPASSAKRGYLVDLGGTLKIEGWRSSLQAVKPFSFSTVGGAGSGQGNPNVGVIGIALFSEKGSDAMPAK